ncbi:hypothetical protein ACE102_07310 [Bradyrhizobium sp. vgs-9]|uniref:hypothetical protein n=1 Tax=Bradyrhizobium sp. vgs-9 TaxID=208389 RepID=UPI0035D4B4A7
MGPIIAQLSRMGLTNIGFELITDIRTYNRNTPREMGSEAFALAWVDQHPTFKLAEIVAHFKADNRTPSSCYYAVKKLVEAGKLKNLGQSNYARADVKALEAPDAAPEKHHDVTNKDLIWRHVRHRNKFKVADLTTLFREQDRNPKSISPQLQHLVTEKRIKALGDGEYAVLKSGATPKKDSPPKKQAAPAPHLNGASQHGQAEAVING